MKATAEYPPDCASSISLLPTNGGLLPLICRSPARASWSAKITPTSLSRAENQANGGTCDTSRNRMQAGAPEDRKNDLMPGSWFEAWSTAALALSVSISRPRYCAARPAYFKADDPTTGL